MKFLIIDIAKRIGNKNEPQYAVQRLKEELDKRSIACDLAHYSDIILRVSDQEMLIEVNGISLNSYTHVIVRGHRTPYEYMLKLAIVAFCEKHGIILQNSAFMKKWAHYDKVLQMQYFADAGLPYLESAYCIDGKYWEKKEILARLGFPLIYKHREGEYKVQLIDGKEKLKKNVYLVNNAQDLETACKTYDEIEDEFITKPSRYMIQKFLDTGTDYRAIMIGGQYYSGWKRDATDNFLTVSHGEYSLYDNPEPKLKELAIKTAQLLEADYCAVDIIYSNEMPYILEVNMNPGFKAFETKVEGAPTTIASDIIEQLLSK